MCKREGDVQTKIYILAAPSFHGTEIIILSVHNIGVLGDMWYFIFMPISADTDIMPAISYIPSYHRNLENACAANSDSVSYTQ